MYPFARLGLEFAIHRRSAPLPLDGVHVSHHTCWPWDLDPWRELNNGRTLTLYDLGRMPLVMRTGLGAVLRRNRWGITVAGASIRYRRRVRVFERFEMRSAMVGRDPRFLYVQQAMFREGEALSGLLVRAAVTRPGGIVPTDEVVAALGAPADRADPLPPWVAAWSAAEAERPWPPEI